MGAEASIGISGLFKSLIGFGAKAQTEAQLRNIFQERIACKDHPTEYYSYRFFRYCWVGKTQVEIFENINIKVIKNSLSYIIMISPYMKMLKSDGINIKTDLDLSIDIINMDENIKLAKRYFEFEGVTDNSSVIPRFNIDSFKNNYKISDLLKINLAIYAVPVGKIGRKNISIVSEINTVTSDNTTSPYDNPKYGDDNKENDKEKTDDILTVYDVLLAGVAQND